MYSIKITKMTLDDLNNIASILISDFDDFWTFDIFKSEIESSSSYYFVAKKDNEIVGFAGIKVILDEADIMNIVVKKSFRNCGIASLLLSQLINFSRSLNMSFITLEVCETNLPAIHLYEKFGFKNVGLRKNYYGNLSGILMTLKI